MCSHGFNEPNIFSKKSLMKKKKEGGGCERAISTVLGVRWIWVTFFSVKYSRHLQLFRGVRSILCSIIKNRCLASMPRVSSDGADSLSVYIIFSHIENKYALFTYVSYIIHFNKHVPHFYMIRYEYSSRTHEPK